MNEHIDAGPGAPPPPILEPAQQRAPIPPPIRSRPPWGWILGCGCLGLLAVAFLMMLAGMRMSAGSAAPFGDKVALVYIEGPILSGGTGGLFGSAGAMSERVVQDLKRAESESGVRAIVVRVNSPGGSAAASQEIYHEIRRIAARLPVIVSMADMAASGGYYVASAADEIYASSGTLTGSIGVIIQTSDMTGLFGKIGLKPETFKSGKHKDMLSSSRPVTPEERVMANEMVMDIYGQFVNDVLEGRKSKGLTRAELMAVADGRVLTGSQARSARLVDKLGGLEEAIRAAADDAKIKGKPKIWRVKRSFWESLAEARFEIRPEVVVEPEFLNTGTLARQLVKAGE